jgi:predicted ATP-dependent serine protease
MNFNTEHLVGRPELVRRVFEATGTVFNGGRGAEHRVLCPFHNDHNPSMRVNLEKSAYYCDACGAGGDTPGFYSARMGVSLQEGMDDIRGIGGLPAFPGDNGVGNGSHSTRTPLPPAHTSAKQAEPEDYGVETARWDIADRNGVYVATHVRSLLANGKKRFSWKRGEAFGLGGLPVNDVPLYGIDRVKPGAVILTEGEKACDALLAHGMNAVATITGQAATPSAKVLADLDGRDVALWPDLDNVGRKHMERIADALQGVAGSVRVIRWGEQEGDDAADFFERNGTEDQLACLLADAPDATKTEEPVREAPGPAGFDALPTFTEVLQRLPLRGARMNTGVDYINAALDGGMTGGEMYVFAANTGRGKTALATQIALWLAESYGIPFLGLYSDAGEGYTARMIARQLGFSKASIEEQSGETLAAIEQTRAEKGINFRMMPTIGEDSTVEGAEAIIVAAGYGDKPAGIVIDSIQETVSRAGGDNETAQIVNAVRACRRLIERHPQWTLIATSERKRPSKDGEDRQSSASGSKKIEYKFDGLFVMEGTTEDGIQITLEKGRFGRRPVPGHLAFDFERLAFSEINEQRFNTATAERSLEQGKAAVEKWAGIAFNLLERKPNGLTATELRRVFKVGNEVKTAVLLRLREAKRVEVTKVGKEETYRVVSGGGGDA